MDPSAFSWDDTALIRAYDQGMSLRTKELEAGLSRGKKQESQSKNKELQWKVGDHCRALYSGDNLMYEAKIVHIAEDTCNVEFLGYSEEEVVDISTVTKTKGKKSRKKQLKIASKLQTQNHIASADESASGDDMVNDSSMIQNPGNAKKVHHVNHRNQMFNHSVDYTAAAESTFQTVYPSPAQFNGIPPTPMMTLGFPPLPPSDLSQNSSLSAMLTSWYMAGYYTGLHQVQKNENCGCKKQKCCQH